MILLRKTLFFLLLFIATIIVAVSFRLFIFSVYTIPTDSMEPCIISGDRVITNKLIPGPRIFKNLAFIKTGEKPALWRLNGIRQIKRNDVLVFNFPYANNKKFLKHYYVKRCVAIPGDTLRIINGFFNVSVCTDTLGSYYEQMKIAETPDESFEKQIYNCFPFDDRHWTIKQFGPLYVPRKGEKIGITPANIALYKKMIEYESEKKISTNGDSILLGGHEISEYTFSLNYYFMAGDKGADSKDSRYWGLLSEDHVVGKATIIWRSKDPHSGKFRKDRFLKTIK